jgi:hypothetical protein
MAWAENGTASTPGEVYNVGVLEYPFVVPVECPADTDGDGTVGFTDLVAVLTAWGPCVGCDEDIDGNGDVGFSDLLSILNSWGDCS